MKSIIVMVMLAFVSACSSNPVKTSQTSDGGTKIRVTATGSTFEEAKSIAFNRAIEYVVGSIVLNEKEAKNNSLARNETLNHSSGYVDDYTVINSTSNGRNVSIEMDVVVKNSRIANRILHSSNTESNINGDKLATQYSSYLDSRKSVSSIITPLLNDYPTRAFTMKKLDSNFGLDIYNNARLVVRYQVDWNYEWVSGIDEALRMASSPRDRSIAQEKIKVIKRKPESWIGSNETYYFNDSTYYDMVYAKFKPTIGIYAKVKDIHGNTVACRTLLHKGIWTMITHVELDGSSPLLAEFDFSFPASQVKQIEAASNIETGVTLDLNYCN
jgi:hypothetical protein